MALMHHGVGRLEMPCEEIGIERRRRPAVREKLSLEGLKLPRRACEFDRAPFIVLHCRSDQFGQLDRREQAGRDPAGKRLAGTGQNRQSLQ